ncbi:MAG: hypothetical protein OXE76_03920 [Alphaproteobacteria bacterium]|nr:hypothetical protein [Alphaproteobacteria bacterium]
MTPLDMARQATGFRPSPESWHGPGGTIVRTPATPKREHTPSDRDLTRRRALLAREVIEEAAVLGEELTEEWEDEDA